MFASSYLVISGLPGNVGSIFVSQLSTALHAASANISLKRSFPEFVVIMLVLVMVPIAVYSFLSYAHWAG
ncbi:hypothetical protein M405DRAFT_814349 [Rhizopogon salebrosus TDB-379]|nr:hypothetical protein M405DRAFT_814349 [Rhizopogon salebrosus TDB-379]